MPGITRPSHLLPSAHTRPKPRTGDLPILDDYVDSSDSELDRVEAGGGRLKVGAEVTGVLAQARMQ